MSGDRDVKIQVTGHPRTETELGVQVNVFASGVQLTFFMPPGQGRELMAQLRIAIEKATGAEPLAFGGGR